MRAPILLRSPSGSVPRVELDPAQQRVVGWRGPGTCVLLGSPGTGATTALVHAAAARLEDVPASQVLVLGRDRDAVRRLRRSIAALVSEGSLPTVTTFHGLAYALVRRTTGPAADDAMPRLLSGAEEDARIRELLRGAIADGDIPWPADLLAATSTLGFANDLRALLARARELGIGPDGLASIGEASGVPTWQVLGRLAEIDDEVMALEGVVDYGRLVEMAIDAAGLWTGTLRYVYVDDFQEAGPLQRRLLQALGGRTTGTVVAADPDTAAFGFRGGDRLGALRLAEETEAQIIVLDRVHAGGGAIRAAYESVRRQPPLPGLKASIVRDYRHPEPASADAGTVDVIAHDTWGDLAACIADDLRRRHLGSDTRAGIPWDSMAIIARSTSHLEVLRRALGAAGVPVVMSSADIPLASEPAVATLLAAITAAIAPGDITGPDAVDLVTGPLLGLDPGDVRSVARALRSEFRQAHPGQAAPPGTDLLAAFLADAITAPDAPAPGARDVRDQIRALGRMLASVAERADADAPPADVLWLAWDGCLPDADGSPWPERLRRAALAGHTPSSHDLDAVLALFATAERLSDRYAGVVGIRGLLAALKGQRVAAERVSTRAPATPAVTLLTAHLAVGLSWDHVVIIGAQEGAWPPAPGGSTALRLPEWESAASGHAVADPAAVLREAAAERIAQERRLFALAVSRARRELVVATVQSDADQPSRFVDDLGVEPQRRSGRPARGLTLDGMVARLRTVAEDVSAPTMLRDAAVRRLAVLAEAIDDAGVPLAPRANPSGWWGLADPTPGRAPVRPADRPVALSGSGLSSLQGCPLRWFLSRVVRAEGPRGRAIAVGSLVHALAERAARGEIPAEPQALLEHVDRIWGELPFDAPWESIAERAEVGRAVERLCAYLRQSGSAVAVEHEFAVTIPLRDAASGDAAAGDAAAGDAAAGDAGDDSFVVRGAIDRIEIDADGRVRLIDFKTARNAPSGPAVESDPQLGMYQLAALHGALADVVDDPDIAGAALVQLRIDAPRAPGVPRIQEQSALGEDDEWLLDAVASAIARIRTEDFPAVVSGECRTCPYATACPAQPEGREVLA